MNEILQAENRVDAGAPADALTSVKRTAAMILAEATNPTQRSLIDHFSRLSTRQREALYAMWQHRLLEKIHSDFHAPGHRPFQGKIVLCLCEADLARMMFGPIEKRKAHYVTLSGLGARMMRVIQSLDTVFYQNVAEIGAGK